MGLFVPPCAGPRERGRGSCETSWGASFHNHMISTLWLFKNLHIPHAFNFGKTWAFPTKLPLTLPAPCAKYQNCGTIRLVRCAYITRQWSHCWQLLPSVVLDAGRNIGWLGHLCIVSCREKRLHGHGCRMCNNCPMSRNHWGASHSNRPRRIPKTSQPENILTPQLLHNKMWAVWSLKRAIKHVSKLLYFQPTQEGLCLKSSDSTFIKAFEQVGLLKLTDQYASCIVSHGLDAGQGRHDKLSLLVPHPA